MTFQLLIALAIFAGLAVLAPNLIDNLTRRRRLKRPHPHLVLVFRLWFGALALATIWLLFHQAHSAR
jgi:hypothetical protein